MILVYLLCISSKLSSGSVGDNPEDEPVDDLCTGEDACGRWWPQFSGGQAFNNILYCAENP